MSEVSSPQFWQDIYVAGDTRWDLGGATPAFARLLHEKNFPAGTMLVPGCGRGYDAVFFAQRGFDVTAVDFADQAVADVRANALAAGVDVTVLQEDVFALGDKFPAAFDYLLEYTCFCAIAPERRAEYERVAATVLKPGGLLIALFFPTNDREGGPPYTVHVEEVRALFANDFELLQEESPADSIKPRAGFETLMIFRRRSSNAHQSSN